MKCLTSPLCYLSAVLFSAAHAQSCIDIVHLTFADSGAGDIALNPNVTNISSWVNGSVLEEDVFGAGIFYMPDPDFNNGYAGLTVPNPNFGFQWGFHGGFDVIGSPVWDVCEISFDYDVLGHNGEASLMLGLGDWSGVAPLPSTGAHEFGPIFEPVNIGERARGTVTFNFDTDTLQVTREGYSTYSTSFAGELLLDANTHAIDVLVSNTTMGGFFDVNADSAQGSNGFYRIDNFRVTASQVPEPSSILTASIATLMMLFRRRRVSQANE